MLYLFLLYLFQTWVFLLCLFQTYARSLMWELTKTEYIQNFPKQKEYAQYTFSVAESYCTF